MNFWFSSAFEGPSKDQPKRVRVKDMNGKELITNTDFAFTKAPTTVADEAADSVSDYQHYRRLGELFTCILLYTLLALWYVVR